MKPIYLDAPNIGALEQEYMRRVLESSYVSTVGPFVSQFENRIKEYVNIPNAVALQNGTTGLYMSLYELGIGPSDEVIVPGLTFIASVNPILYVRARPRIVDVDEKTWTIDVAEVEKAINERTRAIIPVHLFGNPCDMDALLDIASRRGIYVIEDATESLGSKYKGRHMGTFGDMGVLSFNGNKVITTGGGGMVLSHREDWIEHIRFLINQAKADASFYHPEMGFNLRLTNLAAGMGLAQMERLEEFLKRKAEYNRIYRSVLGELPFVHFQEELEGAKSNYWFTAIYLDGIDVEGVIKQAEKFGIPLRRNFRPLSHMPYLKDFANELPVAEKIWQQSLCLPSSTLNTYEQIDWAASKLKAILEEMVK